MSGPDFQSPESLAAWLEASSATGMDLVALDAQTPIAFGGLYRCQGERSHVGWLSLFVHDDHQRKGVGRAMLRAMTAIAWDRWDLRRLELVVVCDNTRAIEFYRRCGFRIEGRHDSFARRADGFVDVYTMARLAMPGDRR